MGRGDDRISCLPDEILESILCSMPLKYAIRTSTLSKRWRHLWQINLISSTSLQFGEDFSCNQSPKQFCATIDRYLQLHGDRNLDKFGILFSPFECFFPNLENWIRTVLTKGIKELDVDLSQGVVHSHYYKDDRMPFLIDDSLFDCNSLTHLSLSRCDFDEPFDSANFVGLNSLSLDYVNIDDFILTEILQTCVSLESISLKRCNDLEMAMFVGDQLKLQKIVIANCRSLGYMEISAPKLMSFVFHGPMHFDWAFENVSNVTDVHFSSVGAYIEDGADVSGILSKFSHVEVLTICSSILTVVQEEGQFDELHFLLYLYNLKELQLIMDSLNEDELYCIFFFFRVCPSPFLEQLFIQCPSSHDQEEDDPSDLIAVAPPDVVFRNLKWIKITNFEGSAVELKLVKLLLEKAVVLESIFLVMNQFDLSNNSLSQRIVQGQLSILPKASVDARIVICGPSDHDCMMNPTHGRYYHQEKYRQGTTMHLYHLDEAILLDQEFL